MGVDEHLCSGSEAGSYLRLIDSCITQLKAQELSRTCNESKEEEGVRTVFLMGGAEAVMASTSISRGASIANMNTCILVTVLG